MPVVINIKVNSEQVLGYLKGMDGRARNLLPVFLDFGERMKGSIRRNFDEQGRPQKWKPLKLSTLSGWMASRKSWRTKSGNLSKKGREALAGRRILTDRGILLNTIYYQASGASLAVGSRQPYAGIHQFGGKTAPHIIRPRTKQALAWPGGGHPVKLVNHPGSNIPARPFLVFQTDDLEYFQQRLGSFVSGDGGG